MTSDPFAIHRENAARDLLDEILQMVEGFSAHGSDDPQMDARVLVDLLNNNFEKLDADDDGISRDELSRALARPAEFSTDEYTMLYLVGKYFDTIAELSDDEPGQDTRITKMDKEILAQFLVYSKMNLGQLKKWFDLDQKQRLYSEPPMTGKEP